MEVLMVSKRRNGQGEVSVSALTVLVMLDAIALAYEQTRTWWRDHVWRRVTKRWRLLDTIE